MRVGRFLVSWNSLLQSLKHPSLWRCLLTGGGYAEVFKLHVNLELSNAVKVLKRIAITNVDPYNLPLDVSRMRNELIRQNCFGNSYLYGVVRMLKPSVVVETGVYHGVSTTFILAAMQDNDHGELWSVDLPNQEYQVSSSGRTTSVSEHLPPRSSTGFVVPEEFRRRWHLELGDSREVLPSLLTRLETVDLFVHDSEHTYETMTYEFRVAWPHLRNGGLLLSDDVGWNASFEDFAKDVGAPFAISRGQAGGPFAVRREQAGMLVKV